MELFASNQSFQSELLQRAVIQRILQLTSNHQTYWDEWQHFSEQFYSFVENELTKIFYSLITIAIFLTFFFLLTIIRLIPFDKFVQTLALHVKNNKNEPLRDNSIIWVLVQCLSKHFNLILK